jgi:hypothetical protein
MSVYVDPVMEHGGSKTFRWARSCHMYADTLAELHSLASAIGMRREWFQNSDTRLPHYDLVPTRRVAAVAAGAVEHSREQMVQFMRRNNPDAQRLFAETQTEERSEPC